MMLTEFEREDKEIVGMYYLTVTVRGDKVKERTLPIEGEMMLENDWEILE